MCQNCTPGGLDARTLGRVAAAALAAELAAVTAAALLRRVEVDGVSLEVAAQEMSEGLRVRVAAEGLPERFAEEMAGYIRDVAALLEAELLAAAGGQQ